MLQGLHEPGARDIAKPLPDQATGRRLIVGIPTAGRPQVLAETVRFLTRQTRYPDLVLISVYDMAHTGGIEFEALPFPVAVLRGAPGLSRQRNAVLEQLAPEDLLMFIDDDFLMAPDYLAQVEEIFDQHPDIVLITGVLIADGILGPGMNHSQGEELLAEAIARPAEFRFESVDTGYGCNTALRAVPIIRQNLAYDEKLPLYSWLEDVDFSARLQPFGRFVRAAATRGVHLGTKTGRTPGLNLGYSQIANPVYMMGKGTLAWPRARRLMIRHLGSNLLGTLRPRPWSDYRGRLIGNLTAILDLCIGRCDPQRILSFKRVPAYSEGRWRKTAP